MNISSNKELLEKLGLYTSFEEKNIVYKETVPKNMSFSNLRDRLIGLGTIIEEDFHANIYVLIVMAGIKNMNSAIVVIKLTHEKLLFASYAKEGIINQHTANKAIDKVIKKILES